MQTQEKRLPLCFVGNHPDTRARRSGYDHDWLIIGLFRHQVHSSPWGGHVGRWRLRRHLPTHGNAPSVGAPTGGLSAIFCPEQYHRLEHEVILPAIAFALSHVAINVGNGGLPTYIRPCWVKRIWQGSDDCWKRHERWLLKRSISL